MHEDIAHMLEPVVTHRTLDALCAWGVSVGTSAAKGWLETKCESVSADTSPPVDALYSVLVADNVGVLIQGALQALRKEITPVYYKDITPSLLLRSTGLSEEEWRALGVEWVLLRDAGLESESCLVADDDAFEYAAHLEAEFYRGVDDVAALGDPANCVRDRVEHTPEYDYDGELVEEKAEPRKRRIYAGKQNAAQLASGTTNVRISIIDDHERTPWEIPALVYSDSDGDDEEDDSSDHDDEGSAPVDHLEPRSIWDYITVSPSKRYESR